MTCLLLGLSGAYGGPAQWAREGGHAEGQQASGPQGAGLLSRDLLNFLTHASDPTVYLAYL